MSCSLSCEGNNRKRKFSEISNNDVVLINVKKTSDLKKVIYRVIKRNQYKCDLHNSFNSCMIYNCPGITNDRIQKTNVNNFDFYS